MTISKVQNNLQTIHWLTDWQLGKNTSKLVSFLWHKRFIIKYPFRAWARMYIISTKEHLKLNYLLIRNQSGRWEIQAFRKRYGKSRTTSIGFHLFFILHKYCNWKLLKSKPLLNSWFQEDFCSILSEIWRNSNKYPFKLEKTNAITFGCISWPGIRMQPVDWFGSQPRCHWRLRSKAHTFGSHVEPSICGENTAKAKAKLGKYNNYFYIILLISFYNFCLSHWRYQ